MPGLLGSFEIDGMALKNRIVLPPIQTGRVSEGGKVGHTMIDYYFRRAEKIGLTIVEQSYVSSQGRLSNKQLGIHLEELIPGLRKLARSIQHADSVAAIQLNHAGKRIGDSEKNRTAVGPTQEEGVDELEKDEIDEIVEDFARAADRAVEAKFDAVEIHGASGFLLNEFYSPLVNQRNDEYGGSFENRIRFPLEVVRRVRENIRNKILIYRLGSTDLDSEGVGIEESVEFAKILESEGVDVIDVSGGICGNRPDELDVNEGYFVSEASKVKEAVDIPVIGGGGIENPEYADEMVREGKVDLVPVGRAQKSDVNWAGRAQEILEEE